MHIHTTFENRRRAAFEVTAPQNVTFDTNEARNNIVHDVEKQTPNTTHHTKHDFTKCKFIDC